GAHARLAPHSDAVRRRADADIERTDDTARYPASAGRDGQYQEAGRSSHFVYSGTIETDGDGDEKRRCVGSAARDQEGRRTGHLQEGGAPQEGGGPGRCARGEGPSPGWPGPRRAGDRQGGPPGFGEEDIGLALYRFCLTHRDDPTSGSS